ncbi:hypothetical protein [Helicobacter mustelae]|uniref:Putative inner membrane protein n=1 Tax=Helicobacter mustelae (strain ATCC 43772 / CCUG 25715 / CIP 103759 / LMG 18044 / NCTC 12198 / R85-136P) TaxID=679897 RepID=D3UGC6_HELM1|nr:hypothetical protein [Helicobacter mustelae]CBG39547.1 putative inner membrane protein [Helicobacter mustelae 12198]SQH71059.1 translocation protein, low temperature [Helicobacter mustelae]
MEKIYPFALIIHLFCAIVFVGYLFFDVVVIPIAKSRIKGGNKLIGSISEVTTSFMPFVILILFLTGGMMVGRYFSTPIDTILQKLLLIKVILASCIFLLVVFSLSCHFIFKCRNPMGKYVHHIIFSLCICIVFLAKWMFFA